jgi:hypothetical protein
VSTQQLFYRSAVPVSAERHRDLAVRAGDSYAFAAGVNSVPLVAAEFAEAAAEYPIVFAGVGEAIFPAVILGIRDNENLMVDADGAWRGRYVPAFIRRYPFVFAEDTGAGTLTLVIDESFPGCNRDGRGERLFDAEGAQTQYLRNLLGFLQDYQARMRRTQAYGKRLAELGLLQPMQAQFTLGDGQQTSLSGFQVVDRQKLKTLPGETLAEMMAADELECTFLHLASMRHFQALIGRATAKPDAPVAAPVEPPPPGATTD